ncbi:hypothetical protein AB0D33_28745 [Streptomyces sp. NPDC048404]|uniref:hypothetical protein n=1 Tax=unclassified Streptomyces TaxID=2593676 RepID=UPI0034236A86
MELGVIGLAAMDLDAPVGLADVQEQPIVPIRFGQDGDPRRLPVALVADVIGDTENCW